MKKIIHKNEVRLLQSDTVSGYLDELSKDKYNPLIQQEIETMIHLSREGDEHARTILICRNLRAVVFIAKNYQHVDRSLSELISAGNIGLIKGVGKAIRTYDPDKGSWSSYIFPRIQGYIVSSLSIPLGGPITLPGKPAHVLQKIDMFKNTYYKSNETMPSLEIIMEHLLSECTFSSLVSVLQAPTEIVDVCHFVEEFDTIDSDEGVSHEQILRLEPDIHLEISVQDSLTDLRRIFIHYLRNSVAGHAVCLCYGIFMREVLEEMERMSKEAKQKRTEYELLLTSIDTQMKEHRLLLMRNYKFKPNQRHKTAEEFYDWACGRKRGEFNGQASRKRLSQVENQVALYFSQHPMSYYMKYVDDRENFRSLLPEIFGVTSSAVGNRVLEKIARLRRNGNVRNLLSSYV